MLNILADLSNLRKNLEKLQVTSIGVAPDRSQTIYMTISDFQSLKAETESLNGLLRDIAWQTSVSLKDSDLAQTTKEALLSCAKILAKLDLLYRSH